ncbi:MAG: helix-turn-helix transcriptional regulator [Lachnospiraceae bacterium]|nr:helix-turn-helix transcriptional regulator [Lachnospiraceae bacterium]
MNIIAENIARRRKELGMTQKELAEILNISDKTLSRWETDKQVPDALMIPELAKALDMSIGEIYGIPEKTKKPISEIEKDTSEEIDYSRITAYKVILLSGIAVFVLGSGIYSFMGVLWNYMKVGALVLLFIGLVVFLTGELTFSEFYKSKERSGVYQTVHKRWLGIVAPLTGLIIGIVIPAIKTPVITLFNNWDAILPLLLFQGTVLALYYREYREQKENRETDHKKIWVLILAVLGAFCIVGFIFNVLNNPYRNMGGFSYQEWQLEKLWARIKFFELVSGIVFLCMNVFMFKETLGLCGSVIKKAVKCVMIGCLAVSLIAGIVVYISNQNLQKKVTYTSGEVPMYHLTNYSHELIEWIQRCNLSDQEIYIRESTVFRGEGETAKAYLIYLPHGSAETEMKITYQLGLGETVLKIETENTTQIADDNYYLCYLEVLNNGESFDIQTYLDGERVMYELDSVTSVWNVFE